MEQLPEFDPVPIPSLTVQQQQKILKSCTSEILEFLSLDHILPYMYDQDLLTGEDEGVFVSHESRQRKITRLITSLPMKGSTALKRFVDCLYCSSQGTAHDKIAYHIEGLVECLMEDRLKKSFLLSEKKCWSIFFVVLAIFLCLLIVFQVNPCLHFRSVCQAVLSHSSPNVPKPGCEHFVGREDDVKIIVKDLYSETTKVLNIVGPPGIGKSTLAKYIGHEMILHFFIVHYVNMAQLPDEGLKRFLAEEIYQSLPGVTPANFTFSDLLSWAYSLPAFGFNHLIVLDNCDGAINNEHDEFQEAVEEVLEYSSYVKFLTTSEEEIVFLNVTPLVHKVKPLSEDAVYELLDHKSLSDAQKKRIADLTGKIPLALQIINSLLNIKPKPPPPAEVIAELEKNPIATITSTGQLNISISISYNHLSTKLKKIVRYIAFFQGPFSENAAIVMLAGYFETHNVTEDLGSKFLCKLVMHSLIEYDDVTGMYQFNKLIRDFILIRNTEAEREMFDLAFYINYGPAICSLSQLYLKSPRNILPVLHREHCHLRHFMNTFQILDRQRIDGKPWQCFNDALRLGYLKIIFSLDDLMKPLKNIAKVTIEAEELLAKSHVLVNSIEHLAHLMELKHSRGQAVQQFMRRVDTLESLPMKAEDYADFYLYFLEYEPELGNEKAKLYHERLLHKIKHSKLSCQPGMCSNRNIGLAYFNLGYYDRSITFLEKAIHDEDLANSSTLVKVYTLLQLRQAYNMAAMYEGVGNTSHVSVNLLSMFPSMVDITSSMVYSNILVFQNYMLFLDDISELHKMKAVQEKICGTLYQVGVRGSAQTVVSAHGLAQQFYESKEYHNVIEMARYALESIEAVQQEEPMTREKVYFRMILSKSFYHLGSTRANELFANTTELLLTLDLRDSFYYQNFVASCSYLVKLGNFAYFGTCCSSILLSSLYVPNPELAYPENTQKKFGSNNLAPLTDYIHYYFKDIVTLADIAKNYYASGVFYVSFPIILFCFYWYMYDSRIANLLISVSIYFLSVCCWSSIYFHQLMFTWVFIFVMFSCWLLQHCNFVSSLFVIPMFGFLLHCLLFLGLFLIHH